MYKQLNMNNMRYIMIFMIAIFLLLGCDKIEPEEVKSSSNASYKVERLFVVDGVTVYRFLDNGRYIYFTNRPGEARYDYRQRHGFTTVTKQTVTLCN